MVYRFPFATPEMVAQDPKMADEWAMLFTVDSVFYANGPLADLGAESSSETTNLAGALHAIDKAVAAQMQPQAAAEAIAQSGFSGFGDIVDDIGDAGGFGSDSQFVGLTELLATGALDVEQAVFVTELLHAMPGVETDPSTFDLPGATPSGSAGRNVFLASRSADAYLFFDPETAQPLLKGSIQVPAGSIEYVSVTPVRASDVLVPGRGNNATATTTTTTLPGDLPVVEAPESTTTTHPWPSIAGS